MITRNGKPVAMVLSISDFEDLKRVHRARRGSLLDFFNTWPEVDIPRRDPADVGREIDL
jgi:hypothetical protein